MKITLHALVIMILLIIDLYVMVTASLIISLIAFFVGLMFLFHYVFALQNMIMAKKHQ